MFCRSGQPWRQSRERPFLAEHGQPKGLGLIGLMGWLGVLVIILVGTVAAANWARQSGREELTRRSLDKLAQAVAAYKQSEGDLSPGVASNAELLKYLNSVEPARKSLATMGGYVFRPTSNGNEILDGWARPLRYVFDGNANARPQLVSDGPDGQDEADDIYAQGLGPTFVGEGFNDQGR